jgi:four helix bundle protein
MSRKPSSEKALSYYTPKETSTMAEYKNLAIWQKSMDLAMQVYDITEKFPSNETYGLASQMQRAAVSIPSNIAEGYGRKSDKEFYYFLHIARGSMYELQTQLYIAAGRDYVSDENVFHINEMIEEISKMTAGLLRRLEKADPELNGRR